MTVRAPDGRVWTVRRRIPAPRWREIDGPDWLDPQLALEFAPLADSPGGMVAAIVAGLVAALVLAVVIVLVLPLVLFLVEALLIVLAALVLGGTWLVQASTAGPPPDRLEWRVRGWRRSRRGVAEVARELGRGEPAAPDDSPA